MHAWPLDEDQRRPSVFILKFLQACRRSHMMSRFARSIGIGHMNDQLQWESISTAPYERDLELAVIEGDHVHSLVFPCRRTMDGWVKASSHERVVVSPTHWRTWLAES